MENEIRNAIIGGLSLGAVLYSIGLSIRIYRKKKAEREARMESLIEKFTDIAAILKASREVKEERPDLEPDSDDYKAEVENRIKFEKIALRYNK